MVCFSAVQVKMFAVSHSDRVRCYRDPQRRGSLSFLSVPLDLCIHFWDPVLGSLVGCGQRKAHVYLGRSPRLPLQGSLLFPPLFWKVLNAMYFLSDKENLCSFYRKDISQEPFFSLLGTFSVMLRESLLRKPVCPSLAVRNQMVPLVCCMWSTYFIYIWLHRV